ncbi:hypothetical protein UFOVP185_15 [uncultured Caudovirales phage]|uniref:Uncharacterized protein n=1 Tax=uncultured Caudovirales phage TaxID=2100421 RepID=A0A6J7WG24_9CAUD|nr:hypothetical protein UFOVP185_15 [uncultured Caudovirales phage]
MGIKRFIFFHPNDGTVPYPNLNNDVNYELLERLQDLEGVIQRQTTNIDNLNERLQRYQGMVALGQTIQSETLIDLSNIPYGDEERIRENLINQHIQNMVVELRNNNLIDITFQRSDWNEREVRLRTRMRIISPNNE